MLYTQHPYKLVTSFFISQTSSTNLRENKQGTKLGSDLPDESRVRCKPFDVPFVAAVEEDRSELRSTGPVIGVDQVTLREFRKIGEAEVVQLLCEILGLVSVRVSISTERLDSGEVPARKTRQRRR